MTPELMQEYRETIQESLRLRQEVERLRGIIAQHANEVERLRALVKDSFLEGYGYLGSWSKRESYWNDSETKKVLEKP